MTQSGSTMSRRRFLELIGIAAASTVCPLSSAQKASAFEYAADAVADENITSMTLREAERRAPGETIGDWSVTRPENVKAYCLFRSFGSPVRIEIPLENGDEAILKDSCPSLMVLHFDGKEGVDPKAEALVVRNAIFFIRDGKANITMQNKEGEEVGFPSWVGKRIMGDQKVVLVGLKHQKPGVAVSGERLSPDRPYGPTFNGGLAGSSGPK